MVVDSKHTQVIYSYYFFPIKFYSLIILKVIIQVVLIFDFSWVVLPIDWFKLNLQIEQWELSSIYKLIIVHYICILDWANHSRNALKMDIFFAKKKSPNFWEVMLAIDMSLNFFLEDFIFSILKLAFLPLIVIYGSWLDIALWNLN